MLICILRTSSLLSLLHFCPLALLYIFLSAFLFFRLSTLLHFLHNRISAFLYIGPSSVPTFPAFPPFRLLAFLPYRLSALPPSLPHTLLPPPPKIHCEGKVVNGPTEEAVVHEVTRLKADLVVVGTHNASVIKK